LRSYRWNVVIAKYCAAVLWFFGTLLLFGKELLTWRLLLALPFFLTAVFHITLAVVELRDAGLFYKRSRNWVRIRREEMISVGSLRSPLWSPFIGYVRLNHFLFPWGMLYFVLDQKLPIEGSRDFDHKLLRHLKNWIISRGPRPYQ
jgi:hypothetical protein